MPLIIIIAIIGFIYISASKGKYRSRKSTSSKPKDDIRYNKKNKHFGVIKGQKTVTKNNKPVKQFTAVFLSSKPADAGKPNIPLVRNPDPIKAKETNRLKRKLNKGFITKDQYNQICKENKLNSYFMKRVRSYDEKSFSNKNLSETAGWSLHPDDRKTADEIFNNKK